jgi:hypothetical protein
MWHIVQLLVTWPRDSEKKCRFFHGFNAMLDRSTKGKEASDTEVIYLSLRAVTDSSLQYVQGACAIGVMFFDLRSGFLNKSLERADPTKQDWALAKSSTERFSRVVSIGQFAA